MRADQKQITGVNRQCDGLSPLSYVQCKAFHLNGVQTELKCKPNVKRCKRFVFVGHSPLLHHNTLKTKAITLFQADHILTRFVFPPLYSAGRLLGTTVKEISNPQVMLCIFLFLVFYILIQAGILYWFSGKDKKLLHWHFDWTGVGFSLTRPIPLKFYRVSLLLPGILLGVMPAIHGFCTGEANIFFLGLFGILGGTGDFLFWYSLRAFDDEDLLLAGKKAFQATIIKRNYGKND